MIARATATPKLLPHLVGDLSRELELLALIVRREPVAFVSRGKPALRAERQALEGHDCRGFLDACPHIRSRLEPWNFRADQSEHHDPIVRNVTQRLVSRFDLDLTEPEWALGYRFDIVLRGRDSTPFEERA